MEKEVNFLGLSGYIWWVGVVESRQDPLKLGRVQVRIRGWHTDDLQAIPSADLPWASIALPPNAQYGFMVPPKEGTMVTGYFLDGTHAQYPILTAIIQGIPETTPSSSKGFSDLRNSGQLGGAPRIPASKIYHTDGSGVTVTEASAAPRFPFILNEPMTSRLARNENIDQTFVQERKNNLVKNVPQADGGKWSEPSPTYAAVYPYNQVYESESGHILEIDDTPGAARISQAHRTGTFYEIQPDGTRVTKVVKNDYEIIMSDKDVYIMGKCNITVQGDANLYVKGNMTEKVDGNLTQTVQGNVTQTVNGGLTSTIQAEADITSQTKLRFVAPEIDIHATTGKLKMDCDGVGMEITPSSWTYFVIPIIPVSVDISPPEIP